MKWNERVVKLIQVAFVDESVGDEVDKTGVYWDPAEAKYFILTAQGGSDWDGYYEERECDSLAEVLTKACHEADGRYLSWIVVQEMISQALIWSGARAQK